jgi:hypothetical protein
VAGTHGPANDNLLANNGRNGRDAQ